MNGGDGMTDSKKKGRRRKEKSRSIYGRTGKLRVGKKGIYFTITSILIISLFTIIYFMGTFSNFRYSGDVENFKTERANNFVDDLENVYLKRGLYALSYNALNAMINHIKETREFFKDPVCAYSSLVERNRYEVSKWGGAGNNLWFGLKESGKQKYFGNQGDVPDGAVSFGGNIAVRQDFQIPRDMVLGFAEFYLGAATQTPSGSNKIIVELWTKGCSGLEEKVWNVSLGPPAASVPPAAQKTVLNVGTFLDSSKDYAFVFYARNKATQTDDFSVGTLVNTSIPEAENTDNFTFLSSPALEGKTLGDLMGFIENNSKQFGYNLSYNIGEVSIKQSGPWYLEATTNISYALTAGNVKFVRKGIFLSSLIDIREKDVGGVAVGGFEDPYFYNLTGISRKVRQTDLGDPSAWNGNDFDGFIVKGEYVENPDAPSFLGLLGGNLSASPFGIETIVPNTVQEKCTSYVEHGFADSSAYGPAGKNLYNVSRNFPNVKLDASHASFYNIKGLTEDICTV